jgi:anaerobic selenocysteine-containing dehydrogenase
MCACRCGINVHMKDGKVAYIEGNRDHPVNKGVLCAKGSSGIMQHCSPGAAARAAEARRPARLRRVRGNRGTRRWSLRPAGKPIREKGPQEARLFHRARPEPELDRLLGAAFGTPNFAAHGGFCSVNMAAGGIYTMGGAFWEFGAPDWEHTKLFMIFGVAEDHASNPIKMGIGKLKERGAKVVVVNPVRTGYNAIADEWVGITPGTDGLFIGALIHELSPHRQDRSRLPDPLHQRAVAGDRRPGTAEVTGFSRATRRACRWWSTGERQGAW